MSTLRRRTLITLLGVAMIGKTGAKSTESLTDDRSRRYGQGGFGVGVYGSIDRSPGGGRVADYTNKDGYVDSEGLLDAGADYRTGEINKGTLGEVAEAFRLGEPAG